MTKQEQIKNERIELLKEIKESLKKYAINNTLITTVKSVSKTGMSRVISFNYIAKDGYIFNLNYKISKILGYKLTDEGVRVYGCGMDMIFNTLYNLNAYALDYGIIKPSKSKNKHELLYNGIVNTRYQYI